MRCLLKCLPSVRYRGQSRATWCDCGAVGWCCVRVKIEVVAVLFFVLTAQCSAEQHTANEPVLFSNECASLTSYFSARSDRIPKKERKKEREQHYWYSTGAGCTRAFARHARDVRRLCGLWSRNSQLLKCPRGFSPLRSVQALSSKYKGKAQKPVPCLVIDRTTRAPGHVPRCTFRRS